MGSSSKIAPEWGREGSEMAEYLSLAVKFSNLLPTRHLGVPSLELVWRGGARPATRVTTVMEPPSGGSITAIFDFTAWRLLPPKSKR